MRKVCTFAAVLILAMSMLFSLTGCGSEKTEIEDLMGKFEHACNTLDLNAVLDCVNPQVSDKVKLAAGVLGLFTDTGTDEIFDSLAGYLSDDSIGGSDFFSSLTIRVNDIAVDGDAALVAVTLAYRLNGEELTGEASFDCIYYADKWYISSFSIV